MNRIKIAIVDDNQHIRFLMKELINEEPDMQLCAEAGNLGQAKKLLSESSPDIVLLDLSMEGPEGGLHFLKELTLSDPVTKTIIFSAHGESTHASKSLKAGAKGYVCKDKIVTSLMEAIRQVHAGKEYVSSQFPSRR